MNFPSKYYDFIPEILFILIKYNNFFLNYFNFILFNNIMALFS